MNEKLIRRAFSTLMGINGDDFAAEIITTGVLSQLSYDKICGNVYYNGQDSIVEYFGIVQWYYFEGQRAKAKTLAMNNQS